VNGYIARKYGVGSIPALFIIGKDGKLVYQATGYGEASIQKIIDILRVEIPKKFSKIKISTH
jgi:thioredoxin-related protein